MAPNHLIRLSERWGPSVRCTRAGVLIGVDITSGRHDAAADAIVKRPGVSRNVKINEGMPFAAKDFFFL